MEPEDEAFEQLALKQGHWQDIGGWRKKQIQEVNIAFDMSYANHVRNAFLEEIADDLEKKFTGPFGRDTVASFAAYIRGMKR
jgi:hypothetical protein